jgi:hypothetical protein
MFRTMCILFAFLPFFAMGADRLPVAPAPRVAAKKVIATIETTLHTGHNQIRQFAFDGDINSYFESEKNAAKTDHFSLVFDTPIALTTVRVITGKPDGTEMLDSGSVEISPDGKTFEMLSSFKEGIAAGNAKEKKVKVIRVRPSEDMKHPLVIREFEFESSPVVAIFKYPIEFVLDYSDAPEMKEWAEEAGRICERNYPMICEELFSPGFKPLTVIHMTLKKDYRGVAAAGGGRITGSVQYFKSHRDDFGAMVHETCHCVQLYRSRRNPGWLVEGIADYIRFFKYEPGKIGRLDSDRAKYDASYRVTAAFLDYVSQKHDPLIVKKLNNIMRDGQYKEEVWKELTGKTVEELNQDWRRSLAR